LEKSEDCFEVEDGVVYRIAKNEPVGVAIIKFKARTLKK